MPNGMKKFKDMTPDEQWNCRREDLDEEDQKDWDTDYLRILGDPIAPIKIIEHNDSNYHGFSTTE